jgi:hypothetical protein
MRKPGLDKFPNILGTTQLLGGGLKGNVIYFRILASNIQLGQFSSLLLEAIMDLLISSEFTMPEFVCVRMPALNQNIPKLCRSY